MTQRYLDIISGKDLRFASALFILAFASGYFTFRGLAIDAHGFLETAACAVFAIASGVMIFLFWTYAIRTVPLYKTVRKICLAWLTVFVAILNILFASSFQNIIGIVGQDALEDHVRGYIVSVEHALDTAYQRSSLVEGVSRDLKSHSVRYQNFADDEFAGGVFSQTSGGTGAVHRSLGSASNRLVGLADAADDFLADAEGQYSIITAQLTEMRRIELLPLPIAERMRLIGPHSDAVQQALSKMNPDSLTGSMRRVAALLPAELDAPRRLSRNASVARKQSEAIALLKDDLTRTSNSLVEFSDEILAGSGDGLRRFKSVSAAKALLAHWDQYIPHIVAAIAIDLAALPVLLFFSIALSGKSETDIKVAKLKAIRLGDLIDAKTASAYYRGQKISSREMEILEADKLGTSSDGDQT